MHETSCIHAVVEKRPQSKSCDVDSLPRYKHPGEDLGGQKGVLGFGNPFAKKLDRTYKVKSILCIYIYFDPPCYNPKA